MKLNICILILTFSFCRSYFLRLVETMTVLVTMSERGEMTDEVVLTTAGGRHGVDLEAEAEDSITTEALTTTITGADLTTIEVVAASTITSTTSITTTTSILISTTTTPLPLPSTTHLPTTSLTLSP